MSKTIEMLKKYVPYNEQEKEDIKDNAVIDIYCQKEIKYYGY